MIRLHQSLSELNCTINAEKQTQVHTDLYRVGQNTNIFKNLTRIYDYTEEDTPYLKMFVTLSAVRLVCEFYNG